MGWQVETWSVAAHLDSHGGDKERAHDALWVEMVAELNRVRDDPKYADLNPM